MKSSLRFRLNRFAIILFSLSLGCGGKPVSPLINSEIITSEDRFGLPNSHVKRVDDRGNGYEKLYGTRNFRAVLSNILYRGGANNKYNREGSRPNRNPLPDRGLRSLCEQGFDTAVYLYSEGFDTAPKRVSCVNEKTGQQASLDYLQISPYKPNTIRELLKIIDKKIHASDSSSAYFHCWNGWHASGLISAYVMRQFCGFSGTLAVQYWDLNTDGNNTDPSFEKLRQQVRDFTPYEDFKLTPEEQSRYCLPLK